MSGSLVVLSGGLDSTVCMSIASRDTGAAPVALTFDYGQRTRPELDRASRVTDHFGSEHLVVNLDTRPWGGSALVDTSLEVPPAETQAGETIPVTYVPARNIIFLSVALGIAEARDLDAVYMGVNALDYSGYPDCRPEFIEAFRRVAALGQKRGVEGRAVDIRTPLISMTKAEIVRQGISMQAPLGLTWSCYLDTDRPCGTCESCVLRAKGFSEAGVPDPAIDP